MTEKGERQLIASFVELFNELPPYNGKIKAELCIHLDGDISLSFNEPIKTRISQLFLKSKRMNTK